METTSEIKAALNDISVVIRNERKAAKAAKARILTTQGLLAAIPTTFSNTVSTIGGYSVSGTAFEKLCKDELSLLTTEFQALKAEVDSTVTAMSGLLE